MIKLPWIYRSKLAWVIRGSLRGHLPVWYTPIIFLRRMLEVTMDMSLA